MTVTSKYTKQKLSKYEQLECFQIMKPLIDEVKRLGLKDVSPSMTGLNTKFRKAMAARTKLILSLNGLIVKHATKLQIQSHKFNEVISYCTKPISRAIILYNPEFGASFSTYVNRSIYGSVVSFIRGDSLSNNYLSVTDTENHSEEASNEDLGLLHYLTSSMSVEAYQTVDAYYGLSTVDNKYPYNVDTLVQNNIVLTEKRVSKIINNHTVNLTI